MRRESYLLQPPTVEIYTVDGGTDIILRKNIKLVEKEELHDDKTVATSVWECEEVQYRYKGTVSKEKVESKFDYWFAIAEGKSQLDAIDDQAIADNEPTVLERLDALESGLADLAEVMCNA